MRTSILACLPLVLLTPVLAQGDECTGATPLVQGNNPFDTSAATASPAPWACGGGGGADVWWHYVATNNAPLQLNTCTATHDTVLEVFTGTCANLVPVACNDDACFGGSALSVPAQGGQEFFIRVGGFMGATGSGQLAFSLGAVTFGADECFDATPIDVGTTPFNTAPASPSPEAWSCGTGSNDLWFRFEGLGGTVSVSTCTSAFNTLLEVYTGSCGSLTSVACNDDSCLQQSEVTFAGTFMQQYYIRVGGSSGALGTGSLEITDPGLPVIGSTYCQAEPNSTGQTGVITARGAIVAAENVLELTASDLPDGEFAYFLASQTQGFIAMPFGSQGNLCIAGSIARFSNQILESSGGQVSAFIDLTDVPEPPAPNTTVVAGQTWNFQCWHRDRDAAGVTNNFTDAVSIAFQ